MTILASLWRVGSRRVRGEREERWEAAAGIHKRLGQGLDEGR